MHVLLVLVHVLMQLFLLRVFLHIIYKVVLVLPLLQDLFQLLIQYQVFVYQDIT